MASQGATINWQKLDNSIQKLITSVDKLETSLKSSVNVISSVDQKFVQAVNNMSTQGSKSFKVVADGISRLVKEISKLDDVGATRFSKVLNDLGSGIGNLSSISRTNTDQIKPLSTFISSINRILKTAANLDNAALGNLKNMVKAVTSTLGELNKLSDFSADTQKRMNSLGEMLRGLSKVFSDETLNNLSKDNVKRVTSAFKSLAGVMSSVGLIMKFIPGQDQVDALAKSMERIGAAFASFSRYAKDAKPGQTKQIAKGFASLAIVFRGIGMLMKHIPGEGETEELSKVFDRLGRGMRSLGNVGRDMNGKQVLQLAKSLIGISLAMRIAAKMAGDTKKIAAMGQALTGIVDVLKFFTEAAANGNGLGDFRKQMKDVASGIKELSKLDGVAKRLQVVQHTVERSTGKRSIATVFRDRTIERATDWLWSAIGKTIGSLWNIKNATLQIARSVGEDLRQVGDSIRDIGSTIRDNFGIQNLLGSSGVSLAIDFDKISSQLKVFGGLTDEQLKKAQDFSNEIGIAYPLSANEALAATLELIKAGQSLSQVEFILPGAADLAALSESGDLDNVTKFLIGATNGYSQFSDTVTSSFENIGTATDVVYQAANASTAGVDSLMQGLLKAAPAANALGLSLEETSAMLVAFDTAGIKGQQGGQQLATVIQEVLKAGGDKTMLDNLIAGNSAVTEFGDKFAQMGLRILRTSERAGNGVESFMEKMRGAGTASDAAVGLLDNLSGEIEQLKGSWETFLTKVALPLLNRFFRPVVKVGRAVIDFLIQLPDPVLETVGTFVVLASAMASIGGTMLILSGMGLRLSGVFVSLSGGVLTLLFRLPMLLISLAAVAVTLVTMIPLILAIAGGFAAISAAVTKVFRDVENDVGGAAVAFEEFKVTVQYIFGEVAEVFSNVYQIMRLFFRTARSESSDASGGGVAQFFVALKDRIKGMGDALSQVNDLLGTFQIFMRGTGTADSFERYRVALEKLTEVPLVQKIFGDDVTAVELDRFFINVNDTMQRIYSAAADVGAGLIGSLLGTKDATRLGAGIQDSLKLAIQGAGGITGVDFSSSLLMIDQGKIGAAGKEFVLAILRSIRQAISSHSDQLKNILGNLLNFIFNKFKGLEKIARFLGLDAIADGFLQLSNQISGYLDALSGWIVDVLGGGGSVAAQVTGEQSLFGKIAATIRTFWSAVQSVLAELMPLIDELGGALVSSFIAVLPDVLANLKSSFDMVMQLAKGIWPIVQGFAQAVFPMIQSLMQLVASNVLPVYQAIIDGFKTLLKTIKPYILAFVMFAGGLVSVVETVVGTLFKLAEDVVRTVAALIPPIIALFSKIVGFVVTRVGPLIAQVFSQIILPMVNLLINAFRILLAVVGPVFYGIVQALNIAWPIIEIALDVLIIGIETVISVVGSLIYVVSEVFGEIADIMSTSLQVVRPILEKSVIEPLTRVSDLLRNLWNHVAPYIHVFAQGIFHAFKFVTDVVIGLVSLVVDNVVPVFSTIWDIVKVPLGWLKDGVRAVFKIAIGGYISYVKWILNGFISGLSTIWDVVGPSVNAFKDGMVRVIGTVVDYVERLVGWLKDVLETLHIIKREVNDAQIVDDQISSLENIISGGRVPPGVLGFAYQIINNEQATDAQRQQVEALIAENAEYFKGAVSQQLNDIMTYSMDDLDSDHWVGDNIRRKSMEAIKTALGFDSFGEIVAEFEAQAAEAELGQILASALSIDPALAQEDKLKEFMGSLFNQSIAEQDLTKMASAVELMKAFAQAGGLAETEMEGYLGAMEASLDSLDQYNRLVGQSDDSTHQLRNAIAGVRDEFYEEARAAEAATAAIEGALAASNNSAVQINRRGTGLFAGESGQAGIVGNPNVIPEVETESVEETMEDLTGETYEIPIELGDEEFSDSVEDIKEALYQLDRKSEDWEIKESRRRAKELEDEERKMDGILKLENDFEDKTLEDVEDFQNKQVEQSQDHRERLFEIDKTANDSLEDAVAGRDAAAARSALRKATEDTKKENSEFKKKQDRQESEFRLDQQRAKTEHDQKVAKAYNDLRLLEDKHAKERVERLFDYNREMNEQYRQFERKHGMTVDAYRRELSVQQLFLNEQGQLNEHAQQLLRQFAAQARNEAVNAVSNIASAFKGLMGITASATKPTYKPTQWAKSAPLQYKSTKTGYKVPTAFENEGYVTRTGIAKVDAGEMVMKRSNYARAMALAQQGGGSPSVLVQVDLDVHANEYAPEEIADLVEQRTIIGVTTAVERLKTQEGGL